MQSRRPPEAITWWTRELLKLIIVKVSKSQPSTKPSNRSYLIYEDMPRYDRITKILIAAILGAFLVAGIVLLFYAVAAGMAVFGDTLLVALLFYFVFPRRYQVFNTKLRIVLGWPLGWDIPLSTIGKAHAAPGITRWIYRGVRLATSSGTLGDVIDKLEYFHDRQYKMYDLYPIDDKIRQNDVLNGIPEQDESVDYVFLDSPYGSIPRGYYSGQDSDLARMNHDEFCIQLKSVIKWGAPIFSTTYNARVPAISLAV